MGAGGRLDSEFVQAASDDAQAQTFLSVRVYDCADGRRCRDFPAARGRLADGFFPAWVSEFHAASSDLFKRGLGSSADHLAHVRRSPQNVDGEAVGMRHVTGDKVGGRLHQAGDEVYIAGQAVEFRDDQG